VSTVDFEPLTIAVPLREDPAGVLRIGNSHVLLELVLRAFKAGATPEAIVHSYDSLHLPDVYAVIARYLSSPEPFEQYMHVRDQLAEELKNRIQKTQGTQDNLRLVLLARANARKQGSAQTGE
jgi:uncharacterized protein (DUF433 family)